VGDGVGGKELVKVTTNYHERYGKVKKIYKGFSGKSAPVLLPFRYSKRATE